MPKKKNSLEMDGRDGVYLWTEEINLVTIVWIIEQ